MRQYEAMFLFDSAVVPDLAIAKGEVQRILDRANAEIILCRKWDDRRLAYEIKGCKRGLYVLAYFRVDPARVGEIEHDIRLSEKVVRAMVVRADWVTEAKMQEILPEKLELAPTPQAGDSIRPEGPSEPEDLYRGMEVPVDALNDELGDFVPARPSSPVGST